MRLPHRCLPTLRRPGEVTSPPPIWLPTASGLPLRRSSWTSLPTARSWAAPPSRATLRPAQPVAAGQWYDLTVTWTAPVSGESITLQASASQFAEGAMNLGHTLQASEGPEPWTTSDASFDNARLTVTAAVGLPAAPSGLTATAASSSQINLTWTDNSTNRDRLQDRPGHQLRLHYGPDHGDGCRQHDHLQRYRIVGRHHVLLPRTSDQRQWRFCQQLHGERHDHRGRRACCHSCARWRFCFGYGRLLY